jgi:hypothetical protein
MRFGGFSSGRGQPHYALSSVLRVGHPSHQTGHFKPPNNSAHVKPARADGVCDVRWTGRGPLDQLVEQQESRHVSRQGAPALNENALAHGGGIHCPAHEVGALGSLPRSVGPRSLMVRRSNALQRWPMAAFFSTAR